MKEKIAKIGWKNIALVVLAVLLAISVSQLHTLRREYKKVYSQNMELKNASLEAQIQSAGEMSSSDTDSASETDDTKDADSASNKDSKTNSDN